MGRLVQPRPGSLPPGRRPIFPCLPEPLPPGRFAVFSDPGWHAGYERPLPELPALTHVNECIGSPLHRLPSHTHSAFEIVYINAGASEWWAGDDHRRVQRGDLYITRPGEPHGGEAVPEDPQHCLALGLDPRGLGIAAGAPRLADSASEVAAAADQALVLQDSLAALQERVIGGCHGIERIYRRLIVELDRRPTDPRLQPLRLMSVQVVLVDLLLFVARRWLEQRLSLEGDRRPAARPEFEMLLDWLRERLGEPPSVAEMAARVGLSPSHFTVAFRRETGASPIEYLTRLRIDEAARRLAGGDEPVTSIAHDLGFASSQYFSIVFRKQLGCTPTAWRRRQA